MTLSDKIFKSYTTGNELITMGNVKEFIKELKEAINKADDRSLTHLKNIIDKLAGDKLI